MSVDETNVNANSTEFKQGVEAGLNSEEDTNNWMAGNALGQELKDEGETPEPVSAAPPADSSVPLFMSDSQEGEQGNAQDEKDETKE
jgi:hypothetical protein